MFKKHDISHINCFQIKVILTHNNFTLEREIKSDN